MLGILLDVATLFLPWHRAGDRFLVATIAVVATFGVLAAVLSYWAGAVACVLVAAMLLGVLMLSRAAQRRETRRAVKGWRAE